MAVAVAGGSGGWRVYENLGRGHVDFRQCYVVTREGSWVFDEILQTNVFLSILTYSYFIF